MKIYIFTTIIVLIFSACSPSILLLSPKQEVLLKQGKQETKITKKVLEKSTEYYQNLEVYKYKLQSENEVLFYEHLLVEMDWEFAYGPIAILHYIFDGSAVDLLYKDSSLSLMQLKISQDKYVNILAESTYNDEMHYVYGFSNAEFKKLCRNLTDEDVILKHKGTTLNASSEVLSTWSSLMLFLEPLLKYEVHRISDS